MTTYKFNVQMKCGGCKSAVDKALNQLEGVSDIEIDVNLKVVKCNSTKLNGQELLSIIEKTGKTASIIH
ncbi:hypothetical protein DFA_11364 [Cavenderia fasciculata]|uniref:HMA domain-containing protein n=1 Tax=Cavenderia fasciculata TaxID=261658 RepID=F4QCG8_CACFS|nr:uncharacterized protein DFA_11364 [Cavenderia fasciculata]EGG13603.1 hypothetical protein DFA_11364 [Cavenderia fasciculata]|eukprot:XP_004350307.1 hypothetical protein DFA_11364 [Cavenderia fasciculata]